jgi:hypothetical protein
MVPKNFIPNLAIAYLKGNSAETATSFFGKTIKDVIM